MTYISYDENKVLIGFINSDGELEYTIYVAEDGGVLETSDTLNAFEALADSEDIDTENGTQCIKDL